MSELSNFQKQFLASSGQVQVFTQKEFDDGMVIEQAKIMAMAIETTKRAIMIEREECAKIAREAGQDDLAEKILNRIPTQRQ